MNVYKSANINRMIIIIRASLVTGLVKATKEDAFPHLTALPKTERERIAAEAEKLKGIVSIKAVLMLHLQSHIISY